MWSFRNDWFQRMAEKLKTGGINLELEKQNAAVNEEPEAALTQETKEGDKRRRRRPVQSRAPRQEKAPQEACK